MRKYCTITSQYYNDHPNLIKILDIGDTDKHTRRVHLCLEINYNGSRILIPLRKNIGNVHRKFGKIGFPVPSSSKPNAGLDYRYIMIINDDNYLIYTSPQIPNSQINRIESNYDIIEQEAIAYINGYIKKAKKNRIDKTALYRESSLINFHTELGIE